MSASTVVPVISPVGAGSVSIVATSSGSDAHYSWTWYEITATPATGYRLDHLEYTYTYEDLWDGGTTTDSYSGGSPTSFQETQNLDTYYHYGNYTLSSVTAYFVADPGTYFTVSTDVAPPNSGTVTGGGQYEENTQCTLTATAAQGYYFSIWKSSTGQTSSANPMTFYVTADITWTAMFGTHRLIYFDYSGTPLVPGDATVTVDFDPKLWTCEEYGQDHAVTLTVTPSWSAPSTISNQQEFPLTKSTLEGGSTFTIGFTANTHCDAGVYPEITAIVVIQQMNVGTFTIEVPLTVGTQSMSTITASNGRVISLN